jgi:hypothetical protein
MFLVDGLHLPFSNLPRTNGVTGTLEKWILFIFFPFSQDQIRAREICGYEEGDELEHGVYCLIYLGPCVGGGKGCDEGICHGCRK